MVNIKGMNAVEQVEFLEKQLGFVTFSRPPKYWLKTGSKRLNKVLGSEKLGIPYGKEITLAGKQSSGKTLLALRLAGLAQKDGAKVGWVDVENSFDADWARLQGLEPGEPIYDAEGKLRGYSDIYLFNTKFGSFKRKEKKKPVFGKKEPKKKKDPEEEKEKMRLNERQQSAEELLTLVEKWMILQRKLNPDGKVFLGLDSTTALQPEEELEAGYMDQNMRTRMSLAPLLNTLSKRMIPIASNMNALIVFICQLRTNPTANMFENPDYVPGGNGILFYPSTVAWMKRVRNIYERGKNTGLESIIENRKNKMGYGSVEKEKIGVRMPFLSSDWEFVDSDELFKKKKE
jgi:RecA/RadA recombinase